MNKKELDLKQAQLLLVMNEKLDLVLEALGKKGKKKKEKK